MVKTFDILLDLEKDLYSPSSLLFSVSRNDFNTVQLNFVITQDGTPVDLTNKTVELAVKKPSGLTLYQACELTSPQEGKAKLSLNQQAYIEYGIYMAEVYIRTVNELAVTSPFWYQSRTPIFNDTTEEAIQSSNDWSALQEALFAYDLRPKIIEGFPTITPEYIGQMAFDSLNKVTYIASDLTSNSWMTFGTGEGGGGGGNDTILGDGAPTSTPLRTGQIFIDRTNRKAYIAMGATAEDWEQLDNEEFVKQAITWAEVLDKPATFAPEAHGHEIIEVLGLQDALDLKADGIHSHDWAEIDNKPLTFAPEEHNHDWAEVTGKPLAFVPEVHTHAWVDITDKPATFTPSAHNHDWAEVTNKPLSFTPSIHRHDWGEIDGKPLAFVPEVHTHAWVDITDKPLAFNPEAHNHAISEVTGLQDAIDAKANIGASYLKNESYSKAEVYNKTEIDQLTFGTGEGSGVIVEDNLMSNSPTNALSANQGRILEEMKADVIHNHTWGEITSKPLTFAPDAHTHTKSQITDFAHTHTKADITDFAHNHDWAEITGKPLTFSPEIHRHDWGEIDGKPLAFNPEAHNHAIAEVTGLQLALDSKAEDIHTHTKADITDFAHNHTWGEVTDKPLAFVPEVHTHAWVDITDKPLTFEPSAHNHDWAEIDGKPLTFAPDIHTHAWAEITGKPLTFAPETHNHAIGEITGLQGALDGKADDSDLTTKANVADVYTKVETYNKTEVDTIVTGITEGGGTVVEDNLNSNNINSALSANQGRILNETKADINHNHDADYAPITHNHDLSYAPITHNHDWAEVTGKPLTFAPDAHSHNWGEIQQKPTTFTPEAHNHAISEVTGLQLALDGKADDEQLNGHTIWSGTQEELDAIATKDISTLYFITQGDLPPKYATAEQLNGLTIWSGTQEEYDAIATKDSKTLYFIKPSELVLTVTSLTNAVQLDWEVGTATSWAIWRSEVKDTLGEKLVTDLITNTYTDSTALGGTTYYYTLQVENVSRKTISKQVEATPYSITVYGSKRVEFSGYTGWTVYGEAQATADFGNEFTLQGGDRLKIDTTERLRFYLPMGMVGSANTGGIIKANIAGKDDYTIEYGIRFDTGFPWSKGGKVPGFSGGAGYTGGKPAWDGDGFSVRLMWREGGRIIPYLYHYNQPDEFGDTFGETLGYFTDAQEHIVKYYAVLNTGANPDGILKIYLDGVQVFEKRDLIYRTNDCKIDTAHLAIFAGGSDATWNMTADGYIRLNYFDWR